MAESSVMSRILRYLFFLAAVVLIYTEGWPRLKEQIDNRSGEGASCLAKGSKLTDRFGREMFAYTSRRADREAWHELKEELLFAIEKARPACRCELPSCRKGRQGLSELDKLIRRFDNFIDGGEGVVDPQGRLNQVDRILREGKKLASEGQ